MKVLLVHNTYQQPGGEDVVFDQERRMLERAGHTVVLYCRSNSEVNTYSGFKQAKLVGIAVWGVDTKQEFAKLLGEEKPDVVHAHNTFVMVSPSIFSACRSAGVPVVQTLHNYRLFCPASTFFRDGHVCEECVDYGLWRSIKHGCYRDSRPATATVALMLAVHRQRHTWTREVNCYIALTQFARRQFIKAGLPAEKVFVKPNFVEPDPCIGTKDEGQCALFVGRLSPEKRVSTMLNAWKQLPRPHIPLVVLGGGPQLEQLREEARTFGLTSISFRGHLSREETLMAMQKARFLVFPSEWFENFPVTIAESFACGVPVICSRIGAMREIVEDGRTGLHFNAGDAKDLATKIEWAWNHPERMRSMGQAGRREYEAKYTAAKNYPMLMDIYEHAMGKKRLHSEVSNLSLRLATI